MYTSFLIAFLFLGFIATAAVVIVAVLECINFFEVRKARMQMGQLFLNTSKSPTPTPNQPAPPVGHYQ